MRALLVVNPQATATTPGGRDVLAHALASELKLDVLETDYRGHASDVARAAARDEFDLVVAHGGDGTVNEVVNGLLADVPTNGAAGYATQRPMLGVVPGGSANVFARALGLPRDPVEATHQLLKALEERRFRQVGLGLADNRWFTFNAGMGWDADVVEEVERRRGKRTGPVLYTHMALSCYARPPHGRHPLIVQVPGEKPVEVVTAFVSNTDPWSYLGTRPVHLNTECSFDGGLGLFALKSLGFPTVVRHLRHALGQGKHRGSRLVRHDDVPIISVSTANSTVNSTPNGAIRNNKSTVKPGDSAHPNEVNLQVDGDLVGKRSHVEFRAVPRALTVAA